MMERAANEIAIKYGIPNVQDIIDILEKYDLEQELDRVYFKTELEYQDALNENLKTKMADYAAISQRADQLAHAVELYLRSATSAQRALVERELRSYQAWKRARQRRVS